MTTTTLRYLWKQVPVHSINLIKRGDIDQSFNKALGDTAIDFFKCFARGGGKSSAGIGAGAGAGVTSATSTCSRKRRRRNPSSNKSFLQQEQHQQQQQQEHQSLNPQKYVIDSKTGLTTNDYFFEHQRIHGYSQQTMPTPEIMKLQDLLSLEVQSYLSTISNPNHKNSSNIINNTIDTNSYTNSNTNDAATDIAMRLQNYDATVKLDMWATVQIGKGAYHADHVHENVFVSGVYYSSVPKGSSPLVLHRPASSIIRSSIDQEGGRNVELSDVGEECNSICEVGHINGDDSLDDNNGDDNADDEDEDDDADVFVIQPEEGLVVLFPPWLLHGVPPIEKYDDIASTTTTTNTTTLPRISFAFNLSGYTFGDPWDVTR